MEIKILGGGCPKCKRLEVVTRGVVEDLGIESTFTKVKSLSDIMKYDVTTTPALVVDEKVLCFGRIPDREEIREWLGELSG
ncbi:MAG: thioredoxin family protein [Chloroflexota bacterium]|nr:thioredoxin family protein [Chloroflexota bacterium]